MICNIPNISIQSITADPNFKKFLEYGGYAAEGVETAFGKYSDLLKKGLIEPGKEKDAAVKAFADSYICLMIAGIIVKLIKPNWASAAQACRAGNASASPSRGRCSNASHYTQVDVDTPTC